MGEVGRFNQGVGLTGPGRVAGKVCLNEDARPEFVSDLLPAMDGAYGISDDSRRWMRALFYHEHPTSGLFALSRIGSKLPADDPDFPGEAAPYVDLSILHGVGFDEFRIWQDPSDFLFKISRRFMGAGSWEEILKFDGTQSPVQWLFGASFLPTMTNAFDFGSEQQRWRDLFMYRYLCFFGFTSSLPTPGVATFNRITTRSPGTGATGLEFCKRRNAGDYKWCEVSDMLMTVAILKEVDGITKTNIGTTGAEILGAAHNVKVDLTYTDRCRVVFGGLNSAAVTFYCKIQYSTDGNNWYDLTPEGASNGTTNEQSIVGSWGNVPTGALADVYIRAVGRASDADSDPTYKAIELQVR